MTTTHPTEDAPADLAGNVRAEMARRRKRQADLANVIGISQPALSRRLSGLVPFRLSELPAIARFLDVAVSDLITTG